MALDIGCSLNLAADLLLQEELKAEQELRRKLSTAASLPTYAIEDLSICIEPIKHQKEFQNIYNDGKKVYSKNFMFFFKQTENTAFGFSISKKQVKTAVARNKIRRRVKEIIRGNKKSFPQKASIIIIPKKEAGLIKFMDLENEILRALKLTKNKLKT